MRKPRKVIRQEEQQNKQHKVLSSSIQGLNTNVADLATVINKLISNLSEAETAQPQVEEPAASPAAATSPTPRVRKPRRRRTESENLVTSIKEQLRALNKQNAINFKDYQNIKKDIQESIKFLNKEKLLQLQDLLKIKNKTDEDIERIAALIKEGKKESNKTDKKENFDVNAAKENLLNSLYKENIFAGLLGSLFIHPKKKEDPKDDSLLKEYFKTKEGSPSSQQKKPEPVKIKTPQPVKFTPEDLAPQKETAKYAYENSNSFDELIHITSDQLRVLSSIHEHLKEYMEFQRKVREDNQAFQDEMRREGNSPERVAGMYAGVGGRNASNYSPDQVPQQKPGWTSGLMDMIPWAIAGAGLKKAVKPPVPTKQPGYLKRGYEVIKNKFFPKVGAETGEAAIKAAQKIGTKEGIEIGAKAGTKSLIKKIPLLGLIAGVGFGANRLYESTDIVGAGGELLSGIASSIPGIGTAASLGVDAALITRDVKGKTDTETGIVKRLQDMGASLFYSYAKKKEELSNVKIPDMKKLFSIDKITDQIKKIKDIPIPSMPTFQTPDMKKLFPKGVPPGVRFHNPGNLRDTGDKWLGKVGVQKGFTQFESPEFGIRAIAKDMQTKLKKSKTGITLGEFISTYAPPNENNTELYIKTVEKESGIKRNEILKNVEEVYQKVVPAILGMEVGGVLAGTGSSTKRIVDYYGGKEAINKIIESRNVASKEKLTEIYQSIQADKMNSTIKPQEELAQKKESVKPVEQSKVKPEFIPTPTVSGLQMTNTTIDNYNRQLETNGKPIIVASAPVVNNTTNVSGSGSPRSAKVIDARNTHPVFARLQEKDFNMV